MKFSGMTPAVRLPVWRARFVLVGFGAIFGLLIGRSVYLQVVQHAFLQEKGAERYARVIEVPATRGRIFDRNGTPLAVSTPVQSIWAIPGGVPADPARRRQLATLLGLEASTLDQRLGEASGDFVYLRRHLSPETAQRVAALDVPGIHQHREYRRFYPGGEYTAHVVGFTGAGDAGQEGMELAFQAQLGGTPGSRRVIRDRRGRIVEDAGSIRAAHDGRDLVLSIDSKIQSIAHRVLSEAVAVHRAKAGALVTIDVRSGEVLALANVPSYNPNNRSSLSGAQLRNRAITDTFEPGSTLKPFTVALALELGHVNPGTPIATAPGRLTIGKYTIRDTHPAAVMDVTQVLQKSSNVGMAKIALGLPREAMWGLFRQVGLGAVPNLGFPGESSGRVRDYKSWRPIEQATMAYGHGISVSLLQLARAYTVFARDGELVPLSLMRTEGYAAGEKVFSAGTARAVRTMLESAAQPGGTGARARISGWRVAGKTGTAHKQQAGTYAADRYLSSFVGFAPASAPRVVIAVLIDEPGGKEYYGGAVAAPVFASVMQGALRLLSVPYDAPLQPLEIPLDADDAKEST